MSNTSNTKLIPSFVTALQAQKNEVAIIADIRKNALQNFLEKGLPGRKEESYKYSQPAKYFNELLLAKEIETERRLTESQIEALKIPSLDAYTIVLFNGVLQEKLSEINKLPKEVFLTTLKTALSENKFNAVKYFNSCLKNDQDAFSLLNTASSPEGIYLFIPENVLIEKPIHIIAISDSDEKRLYFTRNLIVAETNAQLTVITTQETISEKSKAHTCAVNEIVAADNANVKYYSLQNNNCVSVNNTVASTGKNTHLDTNTISLGGEWTRNNLSIFLKGENAEVHLNGLFISKDNQHIDNQTLVHHGVPNCQSNQIYKGILNDTATGVFNGKIFVARDAQKTNAYQSSKAILLSDSATMNTKPQLEIFADDVKCSHGSSTGQINEEAQFYLQSRGLSKESAKRLLMIAFAADALNTIKVEPLKEFVQQQLESRIGK